MNKQKSNLDEMQEQKLLKIEHNAAWLAFWGLLAAILVQTILGGEDVWRNIIAEWIVFMCLCVYLVIACIKNGIWDRKWKPTLKTHAILSFIAGIACGAILFTSSYIKYNKLLGSVATGLFVFIFTFAATLVVLTIAASLYQKKRNKLEAAGEDEADTNE